MSIATLKRKVNNGNPRNAPISGVGSYGFSLNGTTRNIGSVGQFRLISNVTRTPFRGTQPMGHGGSNGKYYNVPINSGNCNTNNNSIVKKTTLTTMGLFSKKFKCMKSQYPYNWVKDSVSMTQNQLINFKTLRSGECNFEKKEVLDESCCIEKSRNRIGGKLRLINKPFSKNETINSQGLYITTGGVSRKNCLPTPYCLQHYPMMLNHSNNISSCNVNVVTWQDAQKIGLLPSNYMNCSKTQKTITFIVTVSNSRYVINNQEQPELNLIRGYTYVFQISTEGHPFYIKTTQSTGTGNQYSDGITNNGITNGVLIFIVPQSAPNVLYYNCLHHSTMFGRINIKSS
ncbi:MAG: hypothetical protein FJX80_15045 [Bacteroidetes bacterium]|nr:hypothetical protein [Bacteroidota bacterium]